MFVSEVHVHEPVTCSNGALMEVCLRGLGVLDTGMRCIVSREFSSETLIEGAYNALLSRAAALAALVVVVGGVVVVGTRDLYLRNVKVITDEGCDLSRLFEINMLFFKLLAFGLLSHTVAVILPELTHSRYAITGNMLSTLSSPVYLSVYKDFQDLNHSLHTPLNLRDLPDQGARLHDPFWRSQIEPLLENAWGSAIALFNDGICGRACIQYLTHSYTRKEVMATMNVSRYEENLNKWKFIVLFKEALHHTRKKLIKEERYGENTPDEISYMTGPPYFTMLRLSVMYLLDAAEYDEDLHCFTFKDTQEQIVFTLTNQNDTLGIFSQFERLYQILHQEQFSVEMKEELLHRLCVEEEQTTAESIENSAEMEEAIKRRAEREDLHLLHRRHYPEDFDLEKMQLPSLSHEEPTTETESFAEGEDVEFVQEAFQKVVALERTIDTTVMNGYGEGQDEFFNFAGCFSEQT